MGGIKIDKVFNAMRRNGRENCFDIFSMRVNHTDPIAVLDILDNHVEHKRGFTGAGLSEQINMLTPVFALDAKKSIFVPISSEPEVC